jgi:hypothetical protein
MFRFIKDPDENRKCQQDLNARLCQLLPTRMKIRIGLRPRSMLVEVHTDSELWYYGERNDEKDAFCFGFGLYPDPDSSNNIVVQINVDFRNKIGILSGVFAKESRTDNLCVFHTGRIVAGGKGGGPTAFRMWYNAKWYEWSSGHGAFLVGCVDNDTFLHDLKRFVRGVDDFKARRDDPALGMATRTSAT